MNRQILDEAAEWFVEFRVGEVQAAASAQFDEWLRRSPEHIRAYMEIARTYVVLGALNAEQQLDVQKLIACARAGENVIPLGQRSGSLTDSQQSPVRSRTTRSRMRGRALAAASFVGLAFAATLLLTRHNSQQYVTDIGERRSITLADGSIIDLNAHSTVRVHFTSAQRTLELTEGQALFEVARDPSRPFIVHSGRAVVTAVGTQFSVYRKKSGTTVTVVEGRVAVANDSAGEGGVAEHSGIPVPAQKAVLPTFVSAGQQVVVTEDAVATPVSADIVSATAWIQHRLIFDGSRLNDVVEDFNRYNTRQIRVEDPTLEDFHISGTYSSTDPTSLLRFLRDQPGIRVIEADDGVRITRK